MTIIVDLTDGSCLVSIVSVNVVVQGLGHADISVPVIISIANQMSQSPSTTLVTSSRLFVVKMGTIFSVEIFFPFPQLFCWYKC